MWFGLGTAMGTDVSFGALGDSPPRVFSGDVSDDVPSDGCVCASSFVAASISSGSRFRSRHVQG